jgi:hypothetical protein
LLKRLQANKTTGRLYDARDATPRPQESTLFALSDDFDPESKRRGR